MQNEGKQSVLTIIENSIEKASRSHKKISEYLLKNYISAAYMTAQKLSEETNVSESTVVRYAIEIGYDGYPKLQEALKSLIKNKLTSVQRIEVAEERVGSNVFAASFLADIENLKKTYAAIDINEFGGIVDLLLSASKVYIVGNRSSTSLASFFNFYLSLILENVKLVHNASGSEIFEELLRIKQGDVVFGISFPRYSKRTVDAMHFAKNQGASVIALTDSKQSPLVDLADKVLYAGNDTASFVDSLVAPLAMINALIAAVGQRRRAEISQSFAKLEDIWEEYNIYDKDK
ncbi:MAG: N-acetylmannosamine kinase [Clostridiales bacterium GWF2_36_10]|nr:MAG: N-acetylmannosamine kinase [Clostridiales bacterium GWF2_36_10]HAN21907.1 N-acetylmannosamine kinase [Clostridiales bacterium]